MYIRSKCTILFFATQYYILDQGIIATFKAYYVKRSFQYVVDKLNDETLTVIDVCSIIFNYGLCQSSWISVNWFKAVNFESMLGSGLAWMCQKRSFYPFLRYSSNGLLLKIVPSSFVNILFLSCINSQEPFQTSNFMWLHQWDNYHTLPCNSDTVSLILFEYRMTLHILVIRLSNPRSSSH